MEKKQKGFKEQESEKLHGKIGYRKRKQDEEEAERELERVLRMGFKEPPSCLDSAYERRAVEQGLVKSPVFPENKIRNK